MIKWADDALEEKAHPTRIVMVAFWHKTKGAKRGQARGDVLNTSLTERPALYRMRCMSESDIARGRGAL